MEQEPNIERAKHADTIIRNHVIWSMGAGLIPILIADVLAVTAMQLDMVRQLCKLYNVDFAETRGKAIVTSLTSTAFARVTAGSIAKMIPIVGSIVGGATVSAFAGASTYAIGEVFKKHLDSGGTILDFDVDRLKKMYKEMFEKGQKVATDLKGQKDSYAEMPDSGFGTPTSKPKNSPKKTAETETTPNSTASEDPLMTRIRDLAKLKEDGIITEEEFSLLKKKLIG